MNPGEFKRVITFKRLVGEDDWTTETTQPIVCQTWAKIHPVGGKQYWEAQAIGESVSHEIWIRYRTDVNSKMLIEYRGREFEIIYIFNVDEQDQYMKILAKERL